MPPLNPGSYLGAISRPRGREMSGMAVWKGGGRYHFLVGALDIIVCRSAGYIECLVVVFGHPARARRTRLIR